jgi:hypothetical protein
MRSKLASVLLTTNAPRTIQNSQFYLFEWLGNNSQPTKQAIDNWRLIRQVFAEAFFDG